MNFKQEFENTMVELLQRAWHEGEAEGMRRAEAEYNKGYEHGYKEGYKDEKPITAELAYEQGLSDAWECARKIVDEDELSEHTLAEIFGEDKTVAEILCEHSASEAIEKLKKWEDKQKKTEKNCKTCGHEHDGYCNVKHCDGSYSKWTPKQDDTEIKNNEIYECSCGYGWDKTNIANARFHFCPNCGKAVEEKKQDDTEIRVGDEVYYCDINHKRVVTSIFTVNGEKTKAVQFTESGKVAVDDVDELNKTGRHYDIESILKQMQEG